MKIVNGILAFIFNLCLLFSVAVGSVFAIASSPNYYYEQFEKTGVYAQVDENGVEKRKVIRYVGGDKNNIATFSDEQLNVIIDHIIEYLFTDMESFELVMDDVDLNDEVTDNVTIFGEIAVTHMEDVKGLLRTLGIVAIVMGVTAGGLLVYFIISAIKGKGGNLFKWTLIFYGSFVGLIVVFCLFTLIENLVLGIDLAYYVALLWRNFHFIIFPNPEQAMGSFFNDTLTMILSLDLFMAAVVQVLVILACSVAAWMTLAKILDKRAKSMEIIKEE